MIVLCYYRTKSLCPNSRRIKQFHNCFGSILWCWCVTMFYSCSIRDYLEEVIVRKPCKDQAKVACNVQVLEVDVACDHVKMFRARELVKTICTPSHVDEKFVTHLINKSEDHKRYIERRGNERNSEEGSLMFMF